jgi:hypothetical protein
MSGNIWDVFIQARESAKSEKYPEALAQYEYFFDHALAEDVSLSGVRASYCLSEWAALGEKLPEAKIHLEVRRGKALSLFEETKSLDYFRDYVSICRALDCDDVISTFERYSQTDKPLAAMVFSSLDELLIDAERWDLCKPYVERWLNKYDLLVRALDTDMTLSKSIIEVFKENLITVVNRTLVMLHQCEEGDKKSAFFNHVSNSLDELGFSELKTKMVVL